MASKAPAAVGIIMGSQSDWQTMQRAAEILEALGIAYEARIVSAHRTPKRLMPMLNPRLAAGSRSSSPAPGVPRICQV